MRKTEIENFIKAHTRQFEKELRQRAKKTVRQPSTTFAKTAAINIQKKRGFDQNEVIQSEAKKLTDYIVEVNCYNVKILTFKSFLRQLTMEKN